MNGSKSANVQPVTSNVEDIPGWLELARKGEPRIWAQLHREYYHRLWATVQQITNDETLTEDIVQECFIKAHRKIGAFRGESKLSTWIYRIAVNHACDALRKKKRRNLFFHFFPSHGEETEESNLLENLPQPEATLHENERADMKDEIRRAMLTLTPEQRAVVELRLIQGLSTDETAKIMGCKRGTVLSRLYYACQKLKKLLKQNYEQL